MKALLILITLGSVARADSMFASDHDGTLVVSQVAGDTLTTVYEEANSGVIDYGWSDAHALWVLRAQNGRFSIEKIVDGKPQPARVLKHADWNPAAGKPAAQVPSLSITKSGEVWLGRCPAIVTDAKSNREQCPARYLRIDANAEVRDDQPKDVRDDDQIQRPEDGKSGPQRVPGPKGYMFVVTDRGFTCTSPKHRLVFPLGTRWVDSPFWFTTDPAIVHFSVQKNDDFGESDPPKDDGTGDFFLDDCQTYLLAVKKVEPGVVATTEGKHAWKVRRGAKLLGTFTAVHVEVAP